MLIEDEYSNLPDDSELAFAHLENLYRRELTVAIAEADESNTDMYYLGYINRTHAAAAALGLGLFEKWKLPSHKSNLYDAYQDFSTDVEHYLVQIKIRHGRRLNGYSVALDAATKIKLQHHISKIREVIAVLDVAPRKKEALIARITALSDEVDRDRTRFEEYAALSLEVATMGGALARKLKPVKDFLDTVAKILGHAKDGENEHPGLPSPENRRKLAAPQRDDLDELTDAGNGLPF